MATYLDNTSGKSKQDFYKAQQESNKPKKIKEKSKLSIKDLIKSSNIAEILPEEELKAIALTVLEEYEEDLNSRAEWQKTVEKIIKIAKLSIEVKSFPWYNASNAKYPLIPTAVLQFASKTYPSIIRDGKIVQVAVIGDDPTGEKAERARRVSEHMSYQLLIESTDWEENMDKLLHVYPTIGVAFKKTYYDPIKKINESILCLHDEIIVNDNIQSLESAPRITHIVKLTTNTIIENMRGGIYCEDYSEEIKSSLQPLQDYHDILEQHRLLDLDDDGYEEPYIVTVHKDTQTVLRIVARFDPRDVLYTEKEEIVKISPIHYFTDFHCIPRPDGKYHSLGLGSLLLHPNEVINSLLNHLIDAGTLANLQGGLIGNDIDIPGGMKSFQPGEWKKARSLNGAPLKDQIVPITYKEPSQTLFDLLNLMIESTKDLSSVTDVLTGKQPAQNVPATTIQILQQEGQKVFTAMQRRLYRSLKSEFNKLYRLNRIYSDPITYYRLMDNAHAVLKSDYEDNSLDIKPVADPNLSSDSQRIAKAQSVLQLALQTPQAISVSEAVLRLFKEMEIPNPQELIVKPNPNQPPPPEILKIQAEMQKHKDQMDLELRKQQLQEQEFLAKSSKLDADTDKSKAQAMQHIAKAAEIQHGAELDMDTHLLERRKLKLEKNQQNIEVHKINVEHEKNHRDHMVAVLDGITNLHSEINKGNALDAKTNAG